MTALTRSDESREDATGEAASPPTPRPAPSWATLPRAFDVVALCLLGLGAYLARRGTLPQDGLWFDDSWVAAGAVLGRPGELLTVGSGHPGFTGLLMAVDRVGGGDLTYLGVPSLAFGVLAPPALFAALRSLGYARAVSVLVSAALVVAPVHVLYSGRVKGYTLDTLVVLALAVAVPLLARRTWRWPVALAWTVGAIGIGTLSGYALLATAGAGVILVLHPASDRRVRVAAVAAQAVVQAVYLREAQSRTDLAGIEEVMESIYDGHMTFSWNPLTMGSEVLTHLRRLAEVFPATAASPEWWLTVLAVVSVGGLAVAAVRGIGRSETVAARYLLLLVVVAAVGGLLDRFPFGTINDGSISEGGRHTLWMVPALAVGLAAAAQRARGLAARRLPLRAGVDALALAGALALVLVAYEPARPAPFPGSGSASEFVDSATGPDDVVIVTISATFSHAISTTTPVGVHPTPDHQVGFAPDYLDPRVHNSGRWAVSPGTEEEIADWTAEAERVFVVGNGPAGRLDRARVRDTLVELGFTPDPPLRFEWSIVEVYRR
jgi:hypothetical protein